MIIFILFLGLIISSAHLSTVVSNGMEPAIYRGDVVVTTNTNTYGFHEFNPYTDVNLGDVVIYDATWYGEPVIHRVINIEYVNGSKYYVLKGDHNNVIDPYLVAPYQIKSKVISINNNLILIPKLGYIFLWIRGI